MPKLKKVSSVLWYILLLLYSGVFGLACFQAADHIYLFYLNKLSFNFVLFILFFVLALFSFGRAKENTERILVVSMINIIADEVNEKLNIIRNKKPSKQEEFRLEKKIKKLALEHIELVRALMGFK